MLYRELGVLKPDLNDAADRVDLPVALEMAYATESDGDRPSVNQLRSMAAAAIHEGLPTEARSYTDRAEMLEKQAFQRYMTEHPLEHLEYDERVAKVIAALQEKFPEATFALIGDTIMCVDPAGVDCGERDKEDDPRRSWNSIMHGKEGFIVRVDGAEFDTRSGMTAKAYAALMETNDGTIDAALKEPKGGADRRWTWLTGDGRTEDGLTQRATAAPGKDGTYGVRILQESYGTNGHFNICFRPAIRLPKPDND